MAVAYLGSVQNGQINFDEEPELPEGAQVIVVVVKEGQRTGGRKVLTLGDLLDSPLVGMWADREDIVDSAEYARQLREKAQRRQR
jgi:hypothetical protein